MAFNATAFTYDGIPSDVYKLMLYEINPSRGIQTTDTYTATIHSAKSANSYINSHYKTTADTPITMTLTIGSLEPIDARTRGVITAWLMGRQGYKEFRVFQDDYQSMFFRCIFDKQKTTFINGLAYAFTVTAVCDSPFVYSSPVTHKFDITSGEKQIVIQNNSDLWDDYIYPELSFKASGSTSSLTITNKSDSNRVFSFSTLSPNETINVDNQNQIITSSLGLNRSEFFNKKWLRLVYKNNNLSVSGQGVLSVTIPILRKVGF